MQMFLGIFTVGGSLLDDISLFAKTCVARTGEHGFESLETEIDLPYYAVWNYYNNYGPLRVKCIFNGFWLFDGRIEDPTQLVDLGQLGLKLTALGYWSAFGDLINSYTALWSLTQYDKFRPMNELDIASRTPAKYSANKDNQLYFTTQKGIVFANNNDAFGYVYLAPDKGSRQIIGASFDYTLNLPVNWLFQYALWQTGFTGGSGFTLFTGTGTQVSRSVHLTFSGADNFEFVISNQTGANSTPAGETGANFVRITNLRLVTSTTNRINTTLTANRNAGTNVTATVGSTTGMYVGQRLVINSNNNPSESVIVLSIGSSTQFNATFANNYVIGNAVQAHLIYPNEIINDLIATVNALNSTQISASTGYVQNQTIDLTDEVYEDKTPKDIIIDLINRGDNQTTPRLWSALVYQDQRLIVRPRSSGRRWFIDVSDEEITRTISQLANSIYAIYQDASGRKVRTAVSANAQSISRYQITRRKAINVNTTSATQAGIYRDTVLNYQADPVPRVNIKIERLIDTNGIDYPLFMLRAGDLVTIRNMPSLGTAYDKYKTFVVNRTENNLLTLENSVDLELPQPNLNVLYSRVSK